MVRHRRRTRSRTGRGRPANPQCVTNGCSERVTGIFQHTLCLRCFRKNIKEHKGVPGYRKGAYRRGGTVTDVQHAGGVQRHTANLVLAVIRHVQEEEQCQDDRDFLRSVLELADEQRQRQDANGMIPRSTLLKIVTEMATMMKDSKLSPQLRKDMFHGLTRALQPKEAATVARKLDLPNYKDTKAVSRSRRKQKEAMEDKGMDTSVEGPSMFMQTMRAVDTRRSGGTGIDAQQKEAIGRLYTDQSFPVPNRGEMLLAFVDECVAHPSPQ